MPIVVKEDLSKVDELETVVKKFKNKVKAAVQPVKCCFGKRTACFCCFKSLFGEVKQMGLIL